MNYCDICGTRERVTRYRRKDGKEYHLCRDCAPMLADLMRGVCAICRHAHLIVLEALKKERAAEA